jgi:hypothetical protein
LEDGGSSFCPSFCPSAAIKQPPAEPRCKAMLRACYFSALSGSAQNPHRPCGNSSQVTKHPKARRADVASNVGDLVERTNNFGKDRRFRAVFGTVPRTKNGNHLYSKYLACPPLRRSPHGRSPLGFARISSLRGARQCAAKRFYDAGRHRCARHDVVSCSFVGARARPRRFRSSQFRRLNQLPRISLSRPRKNLGRRPPLHDAPRAHDQDFVSHGPREPEIVGNE